MKGGPEGLPYFCHSKRNLFASRKNMCNSVNINVARDFYEIVNETYITIIEIVNATFSSLEILVMQINTGFTRRVYGRVYLLK